MGLGLTYKKEVKMSEIQEKDLKMPKVKGRGRFMVISESDKFDNTQTYCEDSKECFLGENGVKNGELIINDLKLSKDVNIQTIHMKDEDSGKEFDDIRVYDFSSPTPIQNYNIQSGECWIGG